MKTLQIGMSAAPARGGGLNRYYFDLLRALPAAGVSATGCVVGDPAAVPPDMTDVRSVAALDTSLRVRLRGMRTAARADAPGADVVVSHFAPYVFPSLDVIRRRPLVVHFHGPWAAESRLEGDSRLAAACKAAIERVVYGRGRRFIVLSSAFAAVLTEHYGVAPELVRIIPGGVDLARFETADTRPAARAKIGWPQHRRIVFSLRRLVHAKGLEHLVEAAERVVRVVPDVLFLIAGTGPLAQALQESIDRRRLGDHVRLCGFLAEAALPSAYAAADLFVVPTVALEGFGLVVLEALAAGTPALVTPVGGLPEVVAGLDARLVLPGTAPADLARGIVSALASGDANVLPSRAACVAHARRFGWAAIAARVASVYREVT